MLIDPGTIILGGRAALSDSVMTCLLAELTRDTLVVPELLRSALDDRAVPLGAITLAQTDVDFRLSAMLAK